MLIEIHFRLHLTISSPHHPWPHRFIISQSDMNPALALDRLHEDLGDTCICGPRPGQYQPCSGKWRSKKRRHSPSAPTGVRDGLKDDIADLRDRFVLLREPKRRLTATRVANLAMCNECLRADRVPAVVEDLLRGCNELAIRREELSGQREVRLLQQQQPGPVRRWYLWIEAYVRLHFGTPWMAHSRETALRALFPGEYVYDMQAQQEQGYPSEKRYHLRSAAGRDAGYGGGESKAAQFQTPTKRKSTAGSNISTAMPHESPLLDRSRVQTLHRRQSIQQTVYQQRRPQRSPLEARVRRLEDLGRWLAIIVLLVVGLVLGYRLWVWSGASAKVVAGFVHICSAVVGGWARVSDRMGKVIDGLRDGWNA